MSNNSIFFMLQIWIILIEIYLLFILFYTSYVKLRFFKIISSSIF